MLRDLGKFLCDLLKLLSDKHQRFDHMLQRFHRLLDGHLFAHLREKGADVQVLVEVLVTFGVLMLNKYLHLRVPEFQTSTTLAGSGLCVLLQLKGRCVARFGFAGIRYSGFLPPGRIHTLCASSRYTSHILRCSRRRFPHLKPHFAYVPDHPLNHGRVFLPEALHQQRLEYLIHVSFHDRPIHGIHLTVIHHNSRHPLRQRHGAMWGELLR
mmetsp:Transcript_3024/g.5125  ORF Transcript_3024/g.5125 Transcript_3024/m.5125 type:complete len:211 (+) Transcript_3024:1613-2245(+)